VTWVDVAEPDQAPAAEAAPAPEPADPPPPQPFEPDPLPDEMPRPELPAGFQELQVPPEVRGIPEPMVAAPVLAADFRGRGIAGGVSAGRRVTEAAPTAPPPPAAEPGHGEALSLALVDQIPRVLNVDQMLPRMRELYPPALRAADVEGQALAEFVVDANGRVEAESVRVLQSTHPHFESATRALVLLLRWEPARYRGRPVRTWVRMPVDWKITR
jgi:TonB family protein